MKSRIAIAGAAGTECPLSSKLLSAVMARNATEVGQLLAAGADPNATNDVGQNAAHLAASTASPVVVATIIASGADLDALDRNGDTPMAIAARANSLSVVKLFRERGALWPAEARAELAKNATRRRIPHREFYAAVGA